MLPRQIVKLIETSRIIITTDKQLRRNLANELFKAGVPHLQDVSFGSNDKVDFLIGETAIIVRLKGEAASLRAECTRICRSDQVGSMIVVTRNESSSPKSSNHKPILVARMAK